MQYTPDEVPDVPYMPNEYNVREGEFVYRGSVSAQARVPDEGVEHYNTRFFPEGILLLLVWIICMTIHTMIKELSPISIIILCICGALLGGIVCIIIILYYLYFRKFVARLALVLFSHK